VGRRLRGRRNGGFDVSRILCDWFVRIAEHGTQRFRQSALHLDGQPRFAALDVTAEPLERQNRCGSDGSSDLHASEGEDGAPLDKGTSQSPPNRVLSWSFSHITLDETWRMKFVSTSRPFTCSAPSGDTIARETSNAGVPQNL
jgi:hypothetical protein